MTDTARTQPDRGDNRAAVPDPREKRWVVVVADFWGRVDPKDEDADLMVLDFSYALSPKGGGPASVFDSGTWGDKSMARQREGIVYDRLRKDRRYSPSPQALRLGFVADEKLFWSDGEPIDGERIERRAS